MFRREGLLVHPIASDMIRGAVDAMRWPEARSALWLDNAGMVEGLITGVSTKKTTGGRSPWRKAGRCYRAAGWVDFEKATGRADVWLSHPMPMLSEQPNPATDS